MSAYDPADMSLCAECTAHVRFRGDSVAKLFSRPNRATLIQERTQTRNIDSKRRSVGFDCCALAMQRRLLQHNPPETGHVQRTTPRLLWAQRRTSVTR